MGIFKGRAKKAVKATSKAKATVKKATKSNPLKGKAKNFVHSLPKAKKLVKKAVTGIKGKVADAALIPYVMPMKAALKMKGLKTNFGTRTELARYFLANIASRSNFENLEPTNNERTSVKTFNFEMAEGTDVVGMGTEMSAGSVRDMGSVTQIIKAVIDYFKNLRAKKAAGGQLTELEAKLEASADVVDEAVESVSGGDGVLSDEKANSDYGIIGDLGIKDESGNFDFGRIALYIAIIVAVYFLAKKFL